MNLEKKIYLIGKTKTENEKYNHDPESEQKKTSGIKDYLTGIIKNAIDKVSMPKEFNEDDLEKIEPNRIDNKKREIELAEDIITAVYSTIPEQKYLPKESINSKELYEERGRITLKILEYLTKNNAELEAMHMTYAKNSAYQLSQSLIYGKEKAITMFLNNIEKKSPNDVPTERINSFLSKLESHFKK